MFYKKLHHNRVFDVEYEKDEAEVEAVPFYRFCFNENLLLPVYHCFRILIFEMMFLALFLILYILKRFNYCSKSFFKQVCAQR